MRTYSFLLRDNIIVHASMTDEEFSRLIYDYDWSKDCLVIEIKDMEAAINLRHVLTIKEIE